MLCISCVLDAFPGLLYCFHMLSADIGCLSPLKVQISSRFLHLGDFFTVLQTSDSSNLLVFVIINCGI